MSRTEARCLWFRGNIPLYVMNTMPHVAAQLAALVESGRCSQRKNGEWGVSFEAQELGFEGRMTTRMEFAMLDVQAAGTRFTADIVSEFGTAQVEFILDVPIFREGLASGRVGSWHPSYQLDAKESVH